LGKKNGGRRPSPRGPPCGWWCRVWRLGSGSSRQKYGAIAWCVIYLAMAASWGGRGNEKLKKSLCQNNHHRPRPLITIYNKDALEELSHAPPDDVQRAVAVAVLREVRAACCACCVCAAMTVFFVLHLPHAFCRNSNLKPLYSHKHKHTLGWRPEPRAGGRAGVGRCVGAKVFYSMRACGGGVACMQAMGERPNMTGVAFLCNHLHHAHESNSTR
jgi:hypothetical protein